MTFLLRFTFILPCFGGREVKNELGFLALAGENLFQFEVNNLNSVNYQFLSEEVDFSNLLTEIWFHTFIRFGGKEVKNEPVFFLALAMENRGQISFSLK